MPAKYPNLKSVTVYKRDYAFDNSFRVHLLDGKAAPVNLTSFNPAWIGQEVVVACIDSTYDCTIKSSGGVTFDGTNTTMTFNDSNDNVVLFAISMDRWLILVNNGIALSA